MDIGTTRSEIDYVASSRGIDLRGIDPPDEHLKPVTNRDWSAGEHD